ncbi:MAG: DUF6089 family protein [Cyclobacteriaceae bacterium]|nr:DUF6089 family protein [Cyclobacteriaceae bacterium]
MRIRSLLIFSLFVTIILMVDPAYGQRNKYKRRKSSSRNTSHYRGGSAGGKFRPYQYVGGGLNALNYYGDLAPVNKAASTDISFTRPGMGITYGYRFRPNVSARANFNYGRLKGDDITSNKDQPENAPRYYRNLSFRNDIKEFNVGVNVYLLPDYSGPNFRRSFNAYLFVGGGFFFHNPKGKVPEYDYQVNGSNAATKLANAGEWVKLRPLGTEGQYLGINGAPAPYKPFQLSVPINFGLTMAIPRSPVNIHLELGYRFVFTDYLDDVSTSYVSLDQFSDPLARIMSDRSSEPVGAFTGEARDLSQVSANVFPDGNTYYHSTLIGSGTENSVRGGSKDNDMYFVTQIKVTYILNQSRGKRGPAKFR